MGGLWKLARANHVRAKFVWFDCIGNGDFGPKEVLLKVMVDTQTGPVTSSKHFSMLYIWEYQGLGVGSDFLNI